MSNSGTVDFEGLIQQMRSVLAEAKRDLLATEDAVLSRRAEIKKLKKAIEFLEGRPAKATSKASGRVCPECGEGFASKTHRMHRQTAAA